MRPQASLPVAKFPNWRHRPVARPATFGGSPLVAVGLMAFPRFIAASPATPARSRAASAASARSSAKPLRASASTTALTTAGVAPMVPSSPTPFTPIGLVRHGRRFIHRHLERARRRRARNRVVHEARRERLARFGVVDEALAQRLPDALDGAAFELADHDHRIDDAPDVVDRPVAVELHGAGIGIDFDFADVAAVGPARRVDGALAS